MEDRNYYNEMMLTGYETIMSTSFPDDMDEVQRIELLHTFIQYFTKLEDYEKCHVLKIRMENVMAPIKRRRGRPKKIK